MTILGCIVGTAVGDALGLPYEGLSKNRGRRLWGLPDSHHFFLGRGMVSDDTEHACFAAKALIESGFDPDKFTCSLARSLRWWLLSVPAGVGFATARAILKLWLGFAPDKSGVFSAGNGPAMRSPVLGVIFADNPELMKEYVKRSTLITHSDPKAYWGALCAALAASISAKQKHISPSDFLASIRDLLGKEATDEFISLIQQACESADKNESTEFFAAKIGCMNGISGYILHTVPCVIQTWLRHQHDFSGGIQEIILAGGDTDTTAAILGGILGACVGKEGIPQRWIEGICEWPRTVEWMEQLAAVLDKMVKGQQISSPSYFVPGIPIRNLLFLSIVLLHGLRRLFPPY